MEDKAMEKVYNMVDDVCAKIERDQRRQIRELQEELDTARYVCGMMTAALVIVSIGFMWLA